MANYYKSYYRSHHSGKCPTDCIFCREEDIVDIQAIQPTTADLEFQKALEYCNELERKLIKDMGIPGECLAGDLLTPKTKTETPRNG